MSLKARVQRLERKAGVSERTSVIIRITYRGATHRGKKIRTEEARALRHDPRQAVLIIRQEWAVNERCNDGGERNAAARRFLEAITA